MPCCLLTQLQAWFGDVGIPFVTKTKMLYIRSQEIVFHKPFDLVILPLAN